MAVTTAAAPIPAGSAEGRAPATAPAAPAAPSPAPTPPPGGRIAGLDGLRALAVSAVVVYHLGAGWLPGGFLGVDAFFVISGFLITTLLLAEFERSGRIRFGAFYLRRARRLLPALFLMLAATLVLAATVARDVAAQTLRDTPGALLYVSNWWALGQEQSYFDLIGRGNLLAHLWSLAVEEQFYLVWPVVVGLLGLVATRTGRSVRRLVLVVAGTGALVSTGWMAAVAVTGGMPIDQDPTRAYFGTDTHAMSVLLGAALAATWDVRRFRRTVAPGARLILLLVGAAGLAAVAWLTMAVSEYTAWLYRGGFLLATILVALVVAGATHPASPLGRVLDNPPMRWVGERSYGIYLWHWPIMLVTRPGIDLPWTGAWVDVTRVAIVLLVAAASYRFVEVPVRSGALGAWWQRRRGVQRDEGLASAWLPRTRRGVVAAAASVLAVTVTAGLLGTAPSVQEVAASRALGTTTDLVDDAAASSGAGAAAGAPGVAAIDPAAPPVSWYGDSVTLWAVDTLRRELPGVRIDAGINRSPAFILSRVLADLETGSVGRAVVLHLGNAGPVPADTLERTLAALGARERVVLVNSNARFAYVPQANATLARVGAAHPNVVVVDWKGLSEGRTDWFKDGLHLTASGEVQFAAAVRAALQQP